MRLRSTIAIAFGIALFGLGCGGAAPEAKAPTAADKASGGDTQHVATSPVTKTVPTVALVKADWCNTCKKLDPVIRDVVASYGDKVRFVVLDITSDETAATASTTARDTGLASFLERWPKKTAVVGIFGANGKTYFEAKGNLERAAYAKAIDAALAGL